MYKIMVMFEAEKDRYRARDLIREYIDAHREMNVITRATKDDQEVKVFDKTFVKVLDDRGISYRRVGLDELRFQMEPENFGILEKLVLTDGWKI